MLLGAQKDNMWLDPDSFFRLDAGKWVEEVIDWITSNLEWLFSFFSNVFEGMYDALDWVLREPPYWVVVIAFVAIAFLAKGWKLAVGTLIGMLFILSVHQWGNAMDTIALVLVATIIALVIGVPMGILAARSEKVSSVIKPLLDFLQTMPAMVYLIPALLLFHVGTVPGIFATIFFAMAPGVRLTELGIRNVDQEVVEAGKAFGSSPGRILRQIQLPLALPSIMAGVNQVIMLSLSMVVIAGMVGADGLGKPVLESISRLNIGLGFEAGVSVVVIAIILDRVTGTLGQPKRIRKAAKA